MDINSYNNYKIKRETMTLIADKLRAVVGKTAKLTPEEIAYYIDRIIFTPQTYGTSEFSSNYGAVSSSVVGVLPNVQSSLAISSFSSLSSIITSSASGAIMEV